MFEQTVSGRYTLSKLILYFLLLLSSTGSFDRSLTLSWEYFNMQENQQFEALSLLSWEADFLINLNSFEYVMVAEWCHPNWAILILWVEYFLLKFILSSLTIDSDIIS